MHQLLDAFYITGYVQISMHAHARISPCMFIFVISFQFGHNYRSHEAGLLLRYDSKASKWLQSLHNNSNVVCMQTQPLQHGSLRMQTWAEEQKKSVRAITKQKQKKRERRRRTRETDSVRPTQSKRNGETEVCLHSTHSLKLTGPRHYSLRHSTSL